MQTHAQSTHLLLFSTGELTGASFFLVDSPVMEKRPMLLFSNFPETVDSFNVFIYRNV